VNLKPLNKGYLPASEPFARRNDYRIDPFADTPSGPPDRVMVLAMTQRQEKIEEGRWSEHEEQEYRRKYPEQFMTTADQAAPVENALNRLKAVEGLRVPGETASVKKVSRPGSSGTFELQMTPEQWEELKKIAQPVNKEP